MVLQAQFRQKISRSTPVFGAKLGLYLCIFLAVLGVVLGFVESSLAVQSNGLITLVDILSSTMFLGAVRQSLRDADFTHNNGYGKYESLAILASAILLSIVLIITILEAVIQFGSFEAINNYPTLITFSTFSFLAMSSMSRIQRFYARKFSMPILNYDADIWKIDSWIELGVTANLCLGFFLSHSGFSEFAFHIDSITAIILLLIALSVPIRHSKEALNQLLDRTITEDEQLKIISIVVEHITSLCEYKTLHTRRSGREIFVELDVVLPFDATLEDAYNVEQVITASVRKVFPNANFRLYAVPCKHECELSGIRRCPAHLSK